MPKSTDLTGQGRTVYDQLNLVLQQKKPIFLKIYAKWCGACKGMATAWSDLCKNDEMAKTDVNFLAIEEDAMNALKIHEKCPESLKTIFNDVKGFPTLVFLNIDGEEVGQYNEGRTVDEMKKAINAKLPVMKQAKGKKVAAATTKVIKGGGGGHRRTTKYRSTKKKSKKRSQRYKSRRRRRQ